MGGRKTGGSFHKNAWNNMTKAVKAKYVVDFDRDRLKNRLKTLKGQYSNETQLQMGSFSRTGPNAPVKENTPLGDTTPHDVTGGMSPADIGSPIFDPVEGAPDSLS
ncbi:hypothetical protein AMTR_s00066p00116650 [Amborella trichopoda]|uniref:Myb/SANT-like domain-containing protein n=1 Tax=Amborella trichopoda TaxID=13333 RepID=U5DI04_AMBTC|nr:hypothetical protein AMTR_s00066p00116650 [Amborella trichopoda]